MNTTHDALGKVRGVHAVAGIINALRTFNNKMVLSTGIGSRKASPHIGVFLYSLLLALWLSLAAAGTCNFDLSTYGNFETANCGSICDSCHFILTQGSFQFGTLNCLADAPCRVSVSTDVLRAFWTSLVNATFASVLTVDTVGAQESWYQAEFYLPQNGGNFSFEAHSLAAVFESKFYAVGTGVLDFKFFNDGLDNTYFPELFSMEVYASTAEALYIEMGDDTRFGRLSDTIIQCPLSGACQWKSKGQPYDDVPANMRPVNLVASCATTDLKLFCEMNADSCAGVYVICLNGTNCEMQYNATEDVWKCIGSLSLANGTINTVDFSSTATPGTSMPLPPTSTSLATDRNCSIDLSDFNETYSTAQCQSGCDSCNFNLTNGIFPRYGTINCLAAVPCLVSVSTNESYSARQSTVNGTVASSLTVQSNSEKAWYYAEFFAPQNGGNFLFESSTPNNIHGTKFYATHDSGVLDLIFTNDGVHSSYFYPELFHMDVYASTAAELSVVFGDDTRFGRQMDSNIECPVNSGTCVCKSKGQRYDAFPENMRPVNLKACPSDTDLRLVCENNADSCAGVHVLCDGKSCEMQYNATEGEWHCGNGTLSLANATIITMNMSTTTVAPDTTTTTRKATTSTRMPSTSRLPTTTSIPTVTVLPMTTNSTAEFECLDQCVIAAHRVDDGYCDCGQCEDESVWSCDSCGGCPLGCGLSVLCEKDSGNKSNDSTLLYAAIGGSLALVCFVAAAIGYFGLFKQSPKARIIELPKVASVSVDADNALEMEMGKRMGEGLAVDHPTAGGSEPGECEDSEERSELKDALRKVAQMKRDFDDEKFGEMIASMRVGNEILEEGVLDTIDDQSLDNGGPETGARDDSEERRGLKAALRKVAKAKRDYGDEKFGKVLASISVGNEILEDDVRDQMDGVQPTRGEGVAETRGLRLSEVLVAAQPEGGDEAIIDEHI